LRDVARGPRISSASFTTTPENFISALTETNDSTAIYPSALAQTATYNNLNQLTNLTGQALTFDSNGNLLSDGQRNYSWDAENRLIGITYSGQPGKQTAFAYDGLSRRTAITSTPAAGTATTTSYIWCGSKICQARNGSNSPIRGYYAEGEFVPGTPAQLYYYGQDQIGSVRRVFASAGNAPAYGYDPYGSALQSTGPLTDFNYAGMFFNADSGLYLTQYRAYDPVAGRWLSRDPLGEQSDVVANLYRYVGGNPVSFQDLSGLQGDGDDPCDPTPTPTPTPTPSPTPTPTEHGQQRQEEGRTDPNRQVGDPNRVIRDGRRFLDSETGNTVYVDGDRVVVTDPQGNRVSQFTNSRANTLSRIQSGRWVPQM
jgi:RHS repeat-associated protein